MNPDGSGGPRGGTHPQNRKVVRGTRRSVVKVKRNYGTSGRVRVRNDPPRSTKLWQSTLLLLLSPLLQLKHLPVDILVPSRGATSAVTTIASPTHVVKCFATTVARRAILRETAEHQPNQPIKHPEQMSVKPTMVVVRSGITRETAPKQQ